MAKSTKSVKFQHAIIDCEADTITEIFKNETNTYTLSELLQEWSGVEELNISISQNVDIPSIESESE